MPVLKSLLVNGEVSMNKLARVASIANYENQEFLAGKVKILSKSAVETLVRDEKIVRKNLEAENKNSLFESCFVAKSVPGHIEVQSGEQRLGDCSLHLSTGVQQKLLELQQKGIDINNLLLEFLNKREEEIAHKKEEIAKKVLQKKAKGISRYKPVAVREILKEEFGTKCSINNCKKLATTIHHTQRFSISRSHDPRYLAPLCNDHHQLAHAVDVRYQEIKNLSRC